MKSALILSAGFGTRLSSLTKTCPKPLLYLKGKRHLENILEKLIALGFEKIIINTHHLPQEFDKAFPESKYKGTELIFSKEESILDTGGAIKYALEQKIIDKSEALLVYNGDILFEGDLSAFIAKNDKKNSASLLLLDDCANKNVCVKDGNVVDLRFKTGAPYDSLAGFAGIFIANTKFLELAQSYIAQKFSNVDVFLELLAKGETLCANFEDASNWSDIGSYSDYLNCQLEDRKLNKAYIDSLNISAISIVEKGASDRKFFKLKTPNKRLVACVYSPQKAENAIYANLAIWLKEQGICVPSIELFEPANNLIIMQDCSNLDLLEASKQAGEEALQRSEKITMQAIESKAIKLYSKAFKELKKLHEIKETPQNICEEFSHTLYKWEQDYFRENFVENFCSEKSILDEAELKNLAQELLDSHSALVHRDCQSQNIMLDGENIYFIDFQGLRKGNKYYDLASLIFDSYTDFSLEFREKLFEISGYDDKAIFYKAACQRLMQALGAFCFLSLKKGKQEYLNYIPKAFNLLQYCAQKANLESLSAQLKLCAKKIKTVNSSLSNT